MPVMSEQKSPNLGITNWFLKALDIIWKSCFTTLCCWKCFFNCRAIFRFSIYLLKADKLSLRASRDVQFSSFWAISVSSLIKFWSLGSSVWSPVWLSSFRNFLTSTVCSLDDRGKSSLHKSNSSSMSSSLLQLSESASSVNLSGCNVLWISWSWACHLVSIVIALWKSRRTLTKYLQKALEVFRNKPKGF